VNVFGVVVSSLLLVVVLGICAVLAVRTMRGELAPAVNQHNARCRVCGHQFRINPTIMKNNMARLMRDVRCPACGVEANADWFGR
jgi:hypothetical protein